MDIIQTEHLVYEYAKRDEEGNITGTSRAIDGVDIDIRQGQFVAVLGHNGSGKSTFAKHLNAILVPTAGTVWVDGKDTKAPEELWNVRQTAGMVFQNPDNQIIGTVVEEDVGFGPENMGVPTREIWERVEESLKAVGMYAYRKYSPNKLSGGQKQRVSIAGVLAMHPQAAVEAIRAGAQEAVARADACRVPMPAYFATTIRYREHKDAYRRSFYPGAALEDDKTISFGTDNWYEMLRFYHFVL